MDPAPERLQKILARTGLGSRRTIESWIKAGLVSVNGRIAQLGTVREGGTGSPSMEVCSPLIAGLRPPREYSLITSPPGSYVPARIPRDVQQCMKSSPN